jgi:DNA glycosylase AlkZ-like
MVRQTTVLIAQMATTAGARAPLAHTANSVFLDLAKELKHQGLGSKVISDMFGLTLRAYHAKVARLSESGTERGRSLWEALLEFVREKGSVSRLTVLEHFSGDEETVVRGVLRDLVDTGLLFRSGRGDRSTYRAATDEDSTSDEDAGERFAHLVWIVVHRYGPLTQADVAERIPAESDAVTKALELLVSDGRIARTQGQTGASYSTDGCVIPLGSSAGWEAAVFDHYQAFVTALCTKLRLGRSRAVPGEWVGGCTYSVQVWDEHPLHDEVLGLLQRTRDHATALRERVEAYNRTCPAPDEGTKKVIFYAGQTVLGLEEEGSDE